MKIIGIGIVAYLLYTLQRLIYERLWDKDLKVSVAFKENGIAEGDTSEILEIIENRKKLPLTMLKVKFQTSKYLRFADDPNSKATDQFYRYDLFQIGGRQKITRTLTFTGTKRGYYNIKNVDYIGSDIFLTSEFPKHMNTASYLYVYPKMYQSKEFFQSLQRLNGDVIVKRHTMEDPFELRGIRDYQPFDDIRSVNWKATARTGEMKVNQKNFTAMQTVRIFLNVEDDGILKKEDELESAMQVVMGLVVYFLSTGVKVSFYSNGKDSITDEPIRIEGGAGSGQRDVVGKALARVDVKKDPWSFCDLFEDLIFSETNNITNIFVSPNGFDDFTNLLKKCNTQGVGYTWFYPYSYGEEPEVDDEIRKNVRYLYIR